MQSKCLESQRYLYFTLLLTSFWGAAKVWEISKTEGRKLRKKSKRRHRWSRACVGSWSLDRARRREGVQTDDTPGPCTKEETAPEGREGRWSLQQVSCREALLHSSTCLSFRNLQHGHNLNFSFLIIKKVTLHFKLLLLTLLISLRNQKHFPRWHSNGMLQLLSSAWRCPPSLWRAHLYCITECIVLSHL